MKPSPERDTITSLHPDLLSRTPDDGLFKTQIRIAEVRARHVSEMSALRKLEHSYRTAARWRQKKGNATPPVSIADMTPRQLKEFRADIQRTSDESLAGYSAALTGSAEPPAETDEGPEDYMGGPEDYPTG